MRVVIHIVVVVCYKGIILYPYYRNTNNICHDYDTLCSIHRNVSVILVIFLCSILQIVFGPFSFVDCIVCPSLIDEFGIFKPFCYTFLGTILLYKLLFKSDNCVPFRLTVNLFHTSTFLYIIFTSSKFNLNIFVRMCQKKLFTYYTVINLHSNLIQHKQDQIIYINITPRFINLSNMCEIPILILKYNYPIQVHVSNYFLTNN